MFEGIRTRPYLVLSHTTTEATPHVHYVNPRTVQLVCATPRKLDWVLTMRLAGVILLSKLTTFTNIIKYHPKNSDRNTKRESQ